MARIRGIGTAQHARRRAIRPSLLWNPLTAFGADLDGWWDPNIGIPVDADVDQWDNQGSAATDLDVVQATPSKQPFGDSTGGPNGNGSVNFTAADAQLLVSSSGYVIAQPHTVLMQVKFEGVAAETAFDGGGAGNRYRVFAPADHLSLQIYSGALLINTHVLGNAWMYVAVSFDGVSSRSDIKDEGSPAIGNAGTNGSIDVTIGAFGSGASNFLEGRVGHVLHVDRDITAEERSDALTWLSQQ